MIAGFSPEEILHEVLVAPRGAFVLLPDTRIIERPGFWQIMTPSLRGGSMNEVACTELPDAEADAIIDEVIASYRRLGVRFRWTIGPGTKPDDLADRLARRGLKRSDALAMARATSDAPPENASPEHAGAISVEEVGLESVDDFTRVMAEGWQSDAAPLDALHRRMLADPARRQRLFLARYERVAAAVAGYVALERSAYLIGGVVLPAFRGRGLYRALVSARLRHAEARGLPLATSVARKETSAPILARLGFETVCALPVFIDS